MLGNCATGFFSRVAQLSMKLLLLFIYVFVLGGDWDA
jgi:hypothetical protein